MLNFPLYFNIYNGKHGNNESFVFVKTANHIKNS